MTNPLVFSNIFPLILYLTLLTLGACGGDSSSSGRAQYAPATISASDYFMVGTAQVQSDFDLANKLSDREQRGFLTANVIYQSLEGGKPLLSFIDRAVTLGRTCQGTWARFKKNPDATFSLYHASDVSKCKNVAISGSNGISIHGPLAAYLETLIVNQAIFVDDNNQPIDVSGLTIEEIQAYHIKQINFKAARVMIDNDEQGVPVQLTEKYAINTSTDFDGSCDFANSVVTDCSIQYVMQFESNGNPITGSLIVFQYNNIGIPPEIPFAINQSYFTSGIIQFEVDYWQGQLNYSALNQAPNYTAEDDQMNFASGSLLP